MGGGEGRVMERSGGGEKGEKKGMNRKAGRGHPRFLVTFLYIKSGKKTLCQSSETCAFR